MLKSLKLDRLMTLGGGPAGMPAADPFSFCESQGWFIPVYFA